MRYMSIKRLKKEADKNDIRSLELLGWEYSKGKKIKKSYPKAFQCYTKSVILGNRNPNIFYNIEIMYWYGRGVKKDIRKSFLWAWKGALLGDPDCMTATGYNYLQGKGTSRDISKARFWYKKAYKFDNSQTPALYSLGCMSYFIDKNYDKAYSLFYKAYNIDKHLRSTYMLGRMLAEGQGCNQNLTIAEKLLRKAKDRKFSQAKRFLKSKKWQKLKVESESGSNDTK